MRHLFKAFFILSLCVLFACGKAKETNDDSSGNVVNQNETIKPDGSNINGIYATDLMPLNKNIHMRKVGVAAVKREGDSFSAYVKIKTGQKSTTLRQAIYTGRRCPNIKDDLNKDAYIDMREALVAIGKIVIPLDSNLDSQQAGLNRYPSGDAVTGTYSYEITASFERMFADLKDQDENTSDNIIKLAADDGLTFPGRIVFLQGLNEKVFLPPTIAAISGESVHKTMPVACGVLWKVNKMPDELMGKDLRLH
ncbi:MAG: hypothetical protein H0V66_14045 [Bdellovibrionales bacterium]|nr:hypothetical protein [Bdellovibrionales bacterium]